MAAAGELRGVDKKFNLSAGPDGREEDGTQWKPSGHCGFSTLVALMEDQVKEARGSSETSRVQRGGRGVGRSS